MPSLQLRCGFAVARRRQVVPSLLTLFLRTLSSTDRSVFGKAALVPDHVGSEDPGAENQMIFI